MKHDDILRGLREAPRVENLEPAEDGKQGSGQGPDGLPCSRCAGSGVVYFRDVPLPWVCPACRRWP